MITTKQAIEKLEHLARIMPRTSDFNQNLASIEFVINQIQIYQNQLEIIEAEKQFYWWTVFALSVFAISIKYF